MSRIEPEPLQGSAKDAGRREGRRPASFISAILPLSLLFFISAPAFASGGAAYDPGAPHKGWEDPEWLALGHYRRGWGAWQSDVVGERFFISPEGRTDPKAEFQATLTAFSKDPAEKGDAAYRCRYPARYNWLRESGYLEAPPIDEEACPRLAAWRRSLRPTSLTVVFASAYMEQPSSVFGHTFIRLNSSDSDLLSYVVNFAADPGSSRGLSYLGKGLTGGFNGYFSVSPYYAQLKKYNDLNARDIWEYDLDLSEPQVSRFVDHLWELSDVPFSYYFLKENCSFQLLSLLAAADPSRVKSLPDNWTIPADTIRLLKMKGSIRSTRYRPSPRTKLLAEKGRLSKEDILLVERLVDGDWDETLSAVGTLPPARQARLLDVAEDYLLYEGGTPPRGSLAEREKAILSARSALKIDSERIDDTPDPGGPIAGHATARVSLGAGREGGRSYGELSLRPALHDLMDPPSGYDKNQQVELLKASVRVDHASLKPYLYEGTLLRLASLQPLQSWDRRLSWELQTGVATAARSEIEPWRSQYWNLRLGPGIAFESETIGRQRWFLLADVDGGAGGVFRKGYRLGGGGHGGVIWEATRRWRISLSGQFFGYAAGDSHPDWSLDVEQDFSLTDSLGLRLQIGRLETGSQISLLLHAYL